MRVTEVHASATHLPIAMFPVAVGADVAGKILGDDRLHRLARIATPVATAGSVAAGATGLVAERNVDTDDDSARLLERHRTINIVTTGASMAMTAYRLGRRRPGWGYLTTGLAAVGALSYSAYLGGKMVYHHGVGIEAAGGTRRESASPPVRTLTDGLRAVGRTIADGLGSLARRLGLSLGDYGPEPEGLQQSIEDDTASAGALPLGSAQRPR